MRDLTKGEMQRLALLSMLIATTPKGGEESLGLLGLALELECKRLGVSYPEVRDAGKDALAWGALAGLEMESES